MLGPPHRARVAAFAASLALGAVAACSGSPLPGEDGSGASSSSPQAASSSATRTSPEAGAQTDAAEAPEPPGARPGRRGERAFARFVMQAWSYALRSNDAGPLLEASRSRKRPCAGCDALRKELARRTRQGWSVDFPGLDVGTVRLDADRAAGTVSATAEVAIPASDSLFDDGSLRSSSPAHPDSTFQVEMRRAGGRYELVGFAVG